MLPETMEYLRKHIDRCKELATDTEAKFDLWLNIASELSQVATQSRSMPNMWPTKPEYSDADMEQVILITRYSILAKSSRLRKSSRQLLRTIKPDKKRR
jgi:hypothetical protein